ncbi:SDR family oxidoreductase [Daejeonella sp.]|uniref:SDR family NAD(P)-dependent oxidoreductase n=1 Tax=Daejeonella sp. TaxID=2805397 RepID=UPI0030C44EC3
MKLINKCAIITGGNQGFGLAVAKAFIMAGANVVLCARNQAKMDETEKHLKEILLYPGQLVCIRADISKNIDTERLVELALNKFGGIDILVANAGVYGPKGRIEDVNWKEWSNAIDINLKGTVLTCKAVIPSMKSQKKGKIIILSGGGASRPMPYLSAYAASKAGVVRFMETLSEELSEFGVSVNAVGPGALNTRLLDEILDSGPERVGEMLYEQSLKQKENGGVPLEKGAELCVYLASADSDGITGKLISAVWDPWRNFEKYKVKLRDSDIYTLRRIVPDDRGEKW